MIGTYWEPSSELKSIVVALRRYWKALVIASFIVGILTAVPWNAYRLNHLGYYSLCSSTPISTITMFLMAGAFYWLGKGRLRLLYGTMIIVLVIFGLVGYWIYAAKMPMDSIQINVAINYVWSGYSVTWNGNISSISINLTSHNPTCQDSPAFRVENYDFHVNDKRLYEGTYDVFSEAGSGRREDIRWLNNHPTTLKAKQTSILVIVITISNFTQIEGNDLETLWTSLTQRNFTLTLTGNLCARFFDESRLVLVASPFTAS